MKRVLASVGLILLVVPGRRAVAQELVIDWSRTPMTGATALPGEGPGGATALQLQAPSRGATFHFVTIEPLSVTAPGYVLTGEVRYEGVEGHGYLEMSSVFPDGYRFFTRTVAADGPLALLEGDSKWRRFELPFNLAGANQLPTRLEISLVLPSSGTVWLGPMRLERWTPQVDMARRPWWSGRSARLAGVLGSVLGLVGALVGVLAARGRARRLVLSLLVGMVVVGIGLALLGGVATLTSQPRHVWYPLVLIGGLSALLGLSILPTVRRRYAMEELRRIQARDA